MIGILKKVTINNNREGTLCFVDVFLK